MGMTRRSERSQRRVRRRMMMGMTRMSERSPAIGAGSEGLHTLPAFDPLCSTHALWQDTGSMQFGLAVLSR